MIHYDFRKGQRVLVIFKDGAKTVGRYEKSSRRWLELAAGRFSWSRIRSVTIYNQGRGKEREG